MPTMTLGERALLVRKLAGFGGSRQGAKFARLLGISAPSLHQIENGDTQALGKALHGYIRIGANPTFLTDNKGTPMVRNVDLDPYTQMIAGMISDLDDSQKALIVELIKQFSGRQPSDLDGSDKEPPASN